MRPSDDDLILHVFNSSRLSGPENLVLPALAASGLRAAVAFLVETRHGEGGRAPLLHAAAIGLPVVEVPVAGRLDARAVRGLAASLERMRPAIAHAHDVKASTYLLAAARLARGARPALISTHHGVHGRPDGKTRAYEALYTRAVLPAFDRVLAVSRADRRDLVGRGLREARVLLHLNGADARRIEPAARVEERARVRAAWGLAPDDGLGIGVVARLSAEKRHDRILEAAAALDRIDPGLGWRLLVFGDGPLRPSLEARAAALGLGARVRFFGHRPGVGDEMAGFDLLLSLSDAEGLPINLIEAGWAGTPVVATAVGGVLDLLGAPPAGVLVSAGAPPSFIARAAHELLVEEGRRASLGAALQARVEAEFSRAAWLRRLVEIYGPLMRGDQGAPQVPAGSSQV